jgi:cobalt-zinc-cadmium efflux system membrane fusion protein
MVMVKLGPEGKGFRPVISGLKAGTEIVIKGAYHLNAERKKQLSGG